MIRKIFFKFIIYIFFILGSICFAAVESIPPATGKRTLPCDFNPEVISDAILPCPGEETPLREELKEELDFRGMIKEKIESIEKVIKTGAAAIPEKILEVIDKFEVPLIMQEELSGLLKGEVKSLESVAFLSQATLDTVLEVSSFLEKIRDIPHLETFMDNLEKAAPSLGFITGIYKLKSRAPAFASDIQRLSHLRTVTDKIRGNPCLKTEDRASLTPILGLIGSCQKYLMGEAFLKGNSLLNAGMGFIGAASSIGHALHLSHLAGLLHLGVAAKTGAVVAAAATGPVACGIAAVGACIGVGILAARNKDTIARSASAIWNTVSANPVAADIARRGYESTKLKMKELMTKSTPVVQALDLLKNSPADQNMCQCQNPMEGREKFAQMINIHCDYINNEPDPEFRMLYCLKLILARENYYQTNPRGTRKPPDKYSNKMKDQEGGNPVKQDFSSQTQGKSTLEQFNLALSALGDSLSITLEEASKLKKTHSVLAEEVKSLESQRPEIKNAIKAGFGCDVRVSLMSCLDIQEKDCGS